FGSTRPTFPVTADRRRLRCESVVQSPAKRTLAHTQDFFRVPDPYRFDSSYKIQACLHGFLLTGRCVRGGVRVRSQWTASSRLVQALPPESRRRATFEAGEGDRQRLREVRGRRGCILVLDQPGYAFGCK